MHFATERDANGPKCGTPQGLTLSARELWGRRNKSACAWDVLMIFAGWWRCGSGRYARRLSAPNSTGWRHTSSRSLPPRTGICREWRANSETRKFQPGEPRRRRPCRRCNRRFAGAERFLWVCARGAQRSAAVGYGVIGTLPAALRFSPFLPEKRDFLLHGRLAPRSCSQEKIRGCLLRVRAPWRALLSIFPCRWKYSFRTWWLHSCSGGAGLIFGPTATLGRRQKPNRLQW